MRWWLGILFLSIQLYAQEPAPIGLVQGSLMEVDMAGSPGEFSIRTAGNQTYRFVFDGKTYFEREKERISAAGLQKGDWLEIVSDKWPSGVERYARTVHVIEPTAPERVPPSVARMRAARSVMNSRPRGDLTFSGVVARLNDERLVLHTHEGERTLLLRRDTRYISEGHTVEPAELLPNTRVFIRADKNANGQIEAYQVVWGEILEPR